LDLYRGYLQRSKGEFTVAKDQYVRLNTGGSATARVLPAAGRPVITQETGFTRFYGGQQRGLFAFRRWTKSPRPSAKSTPTSDALPRRLRDRPSISRRPSRGVDLDGGV